jgi:membrane glycosyltransferase
MISGMNSAERWSFDRRPLVEANAMPLLFLLFYLLTTVFLLPALAPWGAPLSFVLFFQLLAIGLSFDLAETSLALLCPIPIDLPRLDTIPNRCPKLAVVMLICDDLVPEALDCLRCLPPSEADIYILDDSTDPVTHELLGATSLRVVRRGTRAGNKAGSLNHWLGCFGYLYKYFLVLDSDSILPDGFIRLMVAYAEHPENRRVAIFNSLTECWNRHIPFARLLSVATPLSNWLRIRTANRESTVLSVGHNNLHRTAAVLEVGGFDERFVAEDVAITLRLMRAGWLSKVVNVRSYDAEPMDIFSFARRQLRWAKQTIQIQWAPRNGLPLCVHFQLFRLAWMYLGTFLYPTWALVTALGTRSSMKDAHLLLTALLKDDPRVVHALTPFGISLALPVGLLIARVPFLHAAGVPFREFIVHVLLSWAITFYLMFAICRAQIAVVFGKVVVFDVTPKQIRLVTLRSILTTHSGLLVFLVFLSVGLIGNPLAFILAAPWWCVMWLAPVIIRKAHVTRKNQGRIMEPSFGRC